MKKKPGLAAISVSFGPSKGKGHEDEAEEDDGAHDEEYEAARDELADVLGVEEDKREAFGEALRAFVMTCN